MHLLWIIILLIILGFVIPVVLYSLEVENHFCTPASNDISMCILLDRQVQGRTLCTNRYGSYRTCNTHASMVAISRTWTTFSMSVNQNRLQISLHTALSCTLSKSKTKAAGVNQTEFCKLGG